MGNFAAARVCLGILPTLEDWILPEKRIHAPDSMGHNWWSVCVAMAGVAALALLGDDPRAPAWVDAVARGFDFRLAYANVFPGRPLPRQAALAKAGDFFLQTGMGY